MQLIENRSPHAFTVAEFMSLDTAKRTELLAGVVYDGSPRHEPHRYVVRELARILIQGLPRELAGRGGRGRPGSRSRRPRAQEVPAGPVSADAFALIEVSHTTYEVDRGYEIPLYVNAGVPAWIVNINLRQAEFYGSPDDLELKHGRVFAEGPSFDVLGLDIAVSDILDDISGDEIAAEASDEGDEIRD